jgi:aspartyl-tRNA(Asn)/glutamyl-tRNA(Gln) amidotransferase subunit C
VALTLADVEKIAHLARLELTDEEKSRYRLQLSAVLDHAAMLDELDLSEVQPTAHAVLRHNVMRHDVIERSLSLDEVLFNAPQHAQNQFLIQSVLDE